jgi:hypothetical protein
MFLEPGQEIIVENSKAIDSGSGESKETLLPTIKTDSTDPEIGFSTYYDDIKMPVDFVLQNLSIN